MRLLHNLDQINPKAIYLVMALALIVPILHPFGMPITVNDQLTRPVYDWIEGLQPGDVVFFDSAYSAGGEAEVGPQLSAWFYHCMKRGVKVVGVSQWPDGAPLAYQNLKDTSAQCEKDGISAKEGVDWVYVGFKGAGQISVWRAMQSDFWQACGNTDWSNVDFSQLPLMDKVRKWDAAGTKGLIIYSAGSNPGVSTYITYFPDHQVYVGNVAVQVAGAMSTLRSGQIKGMLAGLRGAAEYEKLVGHPGLATKLMDAQSMGHVIIIALVILGNIALIAKKRAGKGRS